MSTFEKESFFDREKSITRFWEKHRVFEQSVKIRENSKSFVFYDGPPFATGQPHYGHILSGTIKDSIGRYKTMKGFFVNRKFGWDCHGLPVETVVEKEKGLCGKVDIEKYGISKFNKECKLFVEGTNESWAKIVKLIGRWVDIENGYLTMSLDFMESVWWVFKTIWDKGLVYKHFKVMFFSPKLGTPISNFEANLNYKTVTDTSVVVKYFLSNGSALLVWTTTPWTLPANVALALNKNLDYVKIKVKEELLILAKESLERYFAGESYSVLETFKGSSLIGLSYSPIFSYFDSNFTILDGDFVNVDVGTGIVHLAPAFGESDFDLCKSKGILSVDTLDTNGYFKDSIHDFKGLLFKDSEKKIIEYLKKKGNWYKSISISHRYPFCWRTDTPLIYRAVSTWFIKVTAVKDKLLENNAQINWVPNHFKEGRFGDWLANVKDWSVSRNRYWGTPIPIWENDLGEYLIVGSTKELEDLTGIKLNDLHREYVDSIEITIKGKKYKRIEEVFDCWFESGSMMVGSFHYPFSGKMNLPADFVAEGIDQTRGWFYTTNVISTILFNTQAFNNVVVNGIVLGNNKQKMSKRLNNYTDPTDTIKRYGADALRFYLLSSVGVKGESFIFSTKGVEVALKKVIIPMWNSYLFFSSYTSEKEILSSLESKPKGELDRWILSTLCRLTIDISTAMDGYFLDKASVLIVDFLENLTNWYIRRSRSRFWGNLNQDKKEAIYTLYTVLTNLVRIVAPVIPFISEAIYQRIKMENNPLSVHLTDFPTACRDWLNEDLERSMSNTRVVVNSSHLIRKQLFIKVRQPLPSMLVVCRDNEILKGIKNNVDVLAEEVNVKKVNFSSKEEDHVVFDYKPNYLSIGEKFKGLIKEVLSFLSKEDRLKRISLGEKIDYRGVLFSVGDVLVRSAPVEKSAVISSGITVILNVEITEDLVDECTLREFVNKINSLRKEKGCNLEDLVEISMSCSEKFADLIDKNQGFLKKETMSKRFVFESNCGEQMDINGNGITVDLRNIEG